MYSSKQSRRVCGGSQRPDIFAIAVDVRDNVKQSLEAFASCANTFLMNGLAAVQRLVTQQKVSHGIGR